MIINKNLIFSCALILFNSISMGYETTDLRNKNNSTNVLKEMPINSQVTMFYYKNISKAKNFYGETLGLEKTLDWGWVAFYQTSPSAFVGLVTEGPNSYHKAKKNNSVMLSLITDDLELSFSQLTKNQSLKILKNIGENGPVKSFLLEDPGGYTVEFFQWLPSSNTKQ